MHENRWNQLPQEIADDVTDFIKDLPARESHYSPKTQGNRKYLSSDLNISKLHRNFISLYIEYENIVSYDFFHHYFKKFNIGFGFPRSDICTECELFNVKIKTHSLENNSEILSIKQDQQKHHLEADQFYQIKKQVKELTKNDNKTFAICFDYEKNLPLPVTKVSSEYYMRQLWVHNFCIHNLKTDSAEIFLYSEHFAGKGPNEVISALNFYINKFKTSAEKLYMFCDNCFAQNKNRFIWMFYLSLVMDEKFEEIIVIYPKPGHSFLECDRDFGRIEKNRLKVQKISFPSQWVDLVEKTDMKFNVNYLNFPLTDDLKSDGKPIALVKDYKNFFERFLANSVDQLSNIRKIKFTKKGVFATTDLFSENFSMNINLFKTNTTVEKFDFQDLQNAYNDYIKIKKNKFDDIKHLLKYVILPQNVSFYNTLTFHDSGTAVSKSRLRAREITPYESHNICNCKGKCMRLCSCKKNHIFCTENCSCDSIECKNKK